jgi:two-component system nitrate/nitrite response regulator NarL
MHKIRILMVDDHNLLREGLSRLLETGPGFRIVGQWATASEAISLLFTPPVEEVLLDDDLGEDGGAGLVTDLRRCQVQVKILMVTAPMSNVATLQIMEAGASAVFLKQSNLDQLVEAIHRLGDNGIWLDGDVVRSIVNIRSSHAEQVETRRPLTARQSEALRGIFDGLADKEIAWKLKTSESSIKAFIQELFPKAGVRTRSQLVRIAIEKHACDWLRPKTGD